MSEAAHCARPAPRTCAVKGSKNKEKAVPVGRGPSGPGGAPQRLGSEPASRGARPGPWTALRAAALSLLGLCPPMSPTCPAQSLQPPPPQPCAFSAPGWRWRRPLPRALGPGEGEGRGPHSACTGAGGRGQAPPGCAWRRGAGPCCRLLSPRGAPQRRSWEWLAGMWAPGARAQQLGPEWRGGEWQLCGGDPPPGMPLLWGGARARKALVTVGTRIQLFVRPAFTPTAQGHRSAPW